MSIESAIPSALVRKVGNPVVRWLLQSPFHWLLSGFVMLLIFRGRKSGRQLVIPVSYHRLDGLVTTFSGGPWLPNLRADSTVEVVLAGRRVRAKVDITDDPAEVANALYRVLTAIGPRNGARFAYRIRGAVPGPERIQEVLEGRRMLRLTLT